jgi:hypothetical protein
MTGDDYTGARDMTRSTELIALGITALVALWAGAASSSVGHAVRWAVIVWVLALLVAVFVLADVAVGVRDHAAQVVVQLARLMGFIGFAVVVGFLLSKAFARRP